MVQLEKYKGTKSRGTCPGCNSRNCFAHYVDENGNSIADDVGRCDRESKCGYHYSPKQYYADNPTGFKFVKSRNKKRPEIKVKNLQIEQPTFDFIPPRCVKDTLNNYDRNAFVQFLLKLFPDCLKEIQDALRMYFVGTYQDYTCFPSIDQSKRICRAKLIRFDPVTGKRLKGKYDTSSLSAKLKLKEDFQYKQIFFGEHLWSKCINKPIAIVESEKTAIISNLCLPQFIWMATGSKQWLRVERLRRFGNHQVILHPDTDGFDQWNDIASHARSQGLTVKATDLLENYATNEQKHNQYDLADYLIEEQKVINQTNQLIDDYNSNLEIILTDKSVEKDFVTILDEQKAILMIDGELSETEADKQIMRDENVRNIVLSL
jgi:hypothetical protein